MSTFFASLFPPEEEVVEPATGAPAFIPTGTSTGIRINWNPEKTKNLLEIIEGNRSYCRLYFGSRCGGRMTDEKRQAIFDVSVTLFTKWDPLWFDGNPGRGHIEKRPGSDNWWPTAAWGEAARNQAVYTKLTKLKVQYDEATQKGLGFKYADWDALRDGNKRLYNDLQRELPSAFIMVNICKIACEPDNTRRAGAAKSKSTYRSTSTPTPTPTPLRPSPYPASPQRPPMKSTSTYRPLPGPKTIPPNLPSLRVQTLKRAEINIKPTLDVQSGRSSAPSPEVKRETVALGQSISIAKPILDGPNITPKLEVSDVVVKREEGEAPMILVDVPQPFAYPVKAAIQVPRRSIPPGFGRTTFEAIRSAM